MRLACRPSRQTADTTRSMLCLWSARVTARVAAARPWGAALPSSWLARLAAALIGVGAWATSGASGIASDPPAERLRELVERAVRYEHAEGTERNFTFAHDLYCRAAREDHTDALVRLGWMYANGRGVARDDAVAHTLFRKAASLGNDLAARLADAVRSQEERVPACLIRRTADSPSPYTEFLPQPPEATLAVLAPPPAPPAPVIATPPTLAQNPASFRPGPASPDYKQWLASALKLAGEFKLDPRLVFALIRAESNFDPQAKSPKNAQGLMQLIPETAERFAVRDILDPLDNLRGGMSYLRWLLSYFKGDVVLALAGYNAGEGAVDRHRGVPPYPETLAYVQRIRALYPLDKHPFDPKAALPMRASWLPPTLPAAVPPPAKTR